MEQEQLEQYQKLERERRPVPHLARPIRSIYKEGWMKFKQTGPRCWSCDGREFFISYDGQNSVEINTMLEKHIIPMVVSAPAMAELLIEIASGKFPGLHQAGRDTELKQLVHRLVFWKEEIKDEKR